MKNIRNFRSIKAWQTSDGKIFEFSDIEGAERHSKLLIKNVEFDKNFESNKNFTIEYAKIKFQFSITGVFLDTLFNCNHLDNPFDKCVYGIPDDEGDCGDVGECEGCVDCDESLYEFPSECCIYCGEPEERK